MEKAKLIETLIIAAVGATAKELVSALIAYTKRHAPMLKTRIIPWLTSRTLLIDGILDILLTIYLGFMSWRIASADLPQKKGQMFFVALLMGLAFFYLNLGFDKMLLYRKIRPTIRGS